MKTSALLASAALLGAGIASATTLMRAQDRSPTQRPRPERSTDPLDAVRSGARGTAANAISATFPAEFRTIDGLHNNLENPEWGAADTAMLRTLPAAYADGLDAPAGADRPGPREISNAVCAQNGSIENPSMVSDFVWMWGQFLDHDLTETPLADPQEPFDLAVPAGDPWFDPAALGTITIPLDRSAYDEHDRVRHQVNATTAYLDASNVYGSDPERAAALRALDGSGRLATSAGDLLPFNTAGLDNAPSLDPSFFLAGDIRASEQAALAAMHTLFVREHNYWVERLGARWELPGDTLYELARAIVGAELQAITMREFLPALLGDDALPAYRGYRSDVQAGVANEFAAAAYRFGHTMLSPQLLRLGADGHPIAEGNLSLSRAFFNPSAITEIGIAPYLRGLAGQRAQAIDPYLIDDVRNFLFGRPGSGGFDLASLNLQRGRDHGLPSYADLAEHYLLLRPLDFDEVSTDEQVRDRLASAYDRVDDIDAWIGLLSEDHAPGALVGPTLKAALTDQFTRLRDGDRFWYESYLPAHLTQLVERQTLATIIRRNTDIGGELQDDVFHVQ